MRNAFLVPLLLLATACATQSAAPGGAEPEVTIVQTSNVASAARFDQGPISIRYAIQVHNVAREPITVVRVALQSIGVGAYELPSSSKPFNETIEPGQSRVVEMWASGTTNPSLVGANGPVTLRGSVEFALNGNHYQKTVVETVHANGGVDR